MELKCNDCPKCKMQKTYCEKLGEVLPNGFAKLYWSKRCHI